MKCINPKTIWPHRSVEWCDRNEEYPVSVPCGKCLACLGDKRVQWSFRLEQELKYSSDAMFVTLTYDEKHLRTNRSLCKRDVQLYLKRLRKRLKSKRIRYYAVGEYGSKSGRPHYHLLLFNCGSQEMVRASWCDSKGKSIGIVHIGKVTPASVAYCTKYVVQPQDAPEGFEKPFALMSRGYGIGGRYLTDEMVRWHRENEAAYAMRDGAKVKLPRFYRTKIWYGQDREAISRKCMLEGIAQEEKKRAFLIKRYGEQWKSKYDEFRHAALARIKVKVAYTQSF